MYAQLLVETTDPTEFEYIIEEIVEYMKSN